MTPCYIFDIDGTLADCSHRLHHICNSDSSPKPKEEKDWTAFFAEVLNDAPIRHMTDLVRLLREAGRVVIFVSGRSDECRAHTERWIKEHVLDQTIMFGEASALYMRKAGDYRDDDILKLELLARIRADGFEPIMVFDDRTRVVKAFRAAGIPCAQVAPGDF